MPMYMQNERQCLMCTDTMDMFLSWTYPIACGAERDLARLPARVFLVGGGSVESRRTKCVSDRRGTLNE